MRERIAGDSVSFPFMFMVLMLGMIILPFYHCGRALGCIESMPETAPWGETSCGLRTEAQCEKQARDRINHPYWFEE